MRGQPWSKGQARALKWAKRLTVVSMFGYACLMAGALLGMSGCATTGQNVVTGPPVMYREWDQGERNEKVQECVDDTASIGMDIGADSEVLVQVYWLCLANQGGAI